MYNLLTPSPTSPSPDSLLAGGQGEGLQDEVMMQTKANLFIHLILF
jgi:hypothetical protein